jgi:ankyrin repeat protein
MTPLHWAVERGNVGAVETLLKYGADVNMESKFDKTPLEIASDNGRPDLYEMLQVRALKQRCQKLLSFHIKEKTKPKYH